MANKQIKQQYQSPVKHQSLQQLNQNTQTLSQIKELTINFIAFDLNRNGDDGQSKAKKKRKSKNCDEEYEKAIIELYAISNDYNTSDYLLGKAFKTSSLNVSS